jgi:uncharacterized protein
MDENGVFVRQKPVTSRAEVIERLRTHEAEFRAWGATSLALYSSAARDELSSESDVDLYIDYDRNGSFDYFKLCRLEDLASNLLWRDVDFGTRDGLHPCLRDDIEATSIKVF